MLTTLALIPSSASFFAESIARETSEPVARRMRSGVPPSGSWRT